MNDQTKPLYKITNVQDTTDFDPTHGQVRAKRVDYTMYDRTRSYVIVHDSHYDPDTVHGMIQEQVANHQQMMGVEVPQVNA